MEVTRQRKNVTEFQMLEVGAVFELVDEAHSEDIFMKTSPSVTNGSMNSVYLNSEACGMPCHIGAACLVSILEAELVIKDKS